jgi:hypothetical protein
VTWGQASLQAAHPQSVNANSDCDYENEEFHQQLLAQTREHLSQEDEIYVNLPVIQHYLTSLLQPPTSMEELSARLNKFQGFTKLYVRYCRPHNITFIVGHVRVDESDDEEYELPPPSLPVSTAPSQQLQQQLSYEHTNSHEQVKLPTPSHYEQHVLHPYYPPESVPHAPTPPTIQPSKLQLDGYW